MGEMMFDKLKIGIKDSNGIEVRNGDKIHGVRIYALPNVDGWGRDLKNLKTSYQTEEFDGIVIFNNGKKKDRAEFIVNTDLGKMDFYEFDKFYVINGDEHV
jgi:hypothetical protein